MGTTTAQASRTRSVALAISGLLVAALAVIAGTTAANAQSGPATGMTMSGAMTSARHVGTTKGWLAGRTVKFVYTKNFRCAEPPSSGAVSHCELGANYNTTPAPEFDPLYVVVPLGFTPTGGTQCATGRCIDHPRHIDLSRIFGSGTENALLPAHSHVVQTAAGQKAEWWNVDVVGVSNQATWNRIANHKNYRTIQRLRSAGNPNVTENLTSNLFLYFKVVR